jgi:6,7-dimethyl-8-ribityllumazine synthase
LGVFAGLTNMSSSSNTRLLQSDKSIPDNKNASIVIVRTEWNAGIVDALENGCKKKLAEAGVRNIKILSVPGAFEIPFGIKNYWKKRKDKANPPKVFIALGCVLRGDTPHFDYICKAVTDGVMQLNLELPVPVIFGVLTVDTQAQAEERIGGKHGHKGEEAAVTAIKMLKLDTQL